MNKPNKPSVLFLCSENSARSQIAEVLLRHKAGELFDVYSAGIKPSKIDSRTITSLQLFDLPVTGLSAKHIDIFKEQKFDYVISVCEQASKEYRDYHGAALQLTWDIADPKVTQELSPFTKTLYALDNRLDMFIGVYCNGLNIPLPTQISLELDDQPPAQNKLSIEPTLFYKSLTDRLRLQILMLTDYYGELCVCELMVALKEQSQPKVSRNLAILKKAGVITDRKNAQWVFYQINPLLPQWMKTVVSQTTQNNFDLILPCINRLNTMQSRPNKVGFCK